MKWFTEFHLWFQKKKDRDECNPDKVGSSFPQKHTPAPRLSSLANKESQVLQDQQRGRKHHYMSKDQRGIQVITLIENISFKVL